MKDQSRQNPGMKEEGSHEVAALSERYWSVTATE